MTVTAAVQPDAHADVCRDGCPTCIDDRIFGDCWRCGDVAESIDGMSRCCGAPVLTWPENDDLREVRP